MVNERLRNGAARISGPSRRYYDSMLDVVENAVVSITRTMLSFTARGGASRKT
jgi:hypothetical protein